MPYLLHPDAPGVVTLSTQFGYHDSTFITSSLNTVNNNAIGYYFFHHYFFHHRYQTILFSKLSHSIICDTHLTDFKIVTPEEIKHIQPVDPTMIQHEDTNEIYINELLKVTSQNPNKCPIGFPTPDESGDPTTYTPIQQPICDELLELKKPEKFIPQNNERSRKLFL